MTQKLRVVLVALVVSLLSQAESWWMGIKAECLGLELHTMGLTVGKSF